MAWRAGFAEVDITPPVLPREKAGWLVKKVGQRVRDPLHARVGVLQSAASPGTPPESRLAVVSVELLSIRWKEVERIRDAAQKLGIARQHVMVAATHNHAGPPAVSAGEVKRDGQYIEQVLLPRVADGLWQAMERLAEVNVGVAVGVEDRVASIRRFVMRDGSVKTHPQDASQIVCAESVLDPQLQVVRFEAATTGKPVGFWVNYALHPTHHGDDDTYTAGWPGRLAVHLKELFGEPCVGMLLNGCFGDVHHGRPCDPEHADDMDAVGHILARDVKRLTQGPKVRVRWLEDGPIRSATCTLKLPWRDMEGPFGRDMKHRQRFAPEAVYEHEIQRLKTKQARRDHFPAEIQAIAVGTELAVVGLPCEPFTELGLRIKRASPFTHTLVVGAANGMVGYVPTRRAFDGGGYECTLITSSCVSEDAADLMVDAAAQVLREIR